MYSSEVPISPHCFAPNDDNEIKVREGGKGGPKKKKKKKKSRASSSIKLSLLRTESNRNVEVEEDYIVVALGVVDVI